MKPKSNKQNPPKQPFNTVIITGIILCRKPQADILIHINLQINTCDQNLNRCCEIIEMNSVIQGQLFTILNETSREGKSVSFLY